MKIIKIKDRNPGWFPYYVVTDREIALRRISEIENGGPWKRFFGAIDKLLIWAVNGLFIICIALAILGGVGSGIFAIGDVVFMAFKEHIWLGILCLLLIYFVIKINFEE